MHINQIEKEKFLASFSEDEFRDKVVRRLFKALGFEDGRDLCGPEEHGKDAIFRERDRFGVEGFVAVQTKVGSITLASDPAKNLHQIIAQVRTALDHPYVCVLSKRSSLPTQVVLVASGVINDRARGYISEQVKDPRIKFLDRDDLIDQIDRHCPEVWAGIVAEISPYFSALANKVDQLSISTQDLNPIHSSMGAFVAAGDEKFVDLKLGYQKLVTKKDSGSVFEDVEFEEVSGTRLFGQAPVRALILGEAGSGKTTLLVRLAYILAKSANVSSKSYKVPILVRAQDLVGKDFGDAFGVLSSLVVGNYNLKNTPFSLDDFEGGRVVLMVDGLDELAEDSDRQYVIDYILGFSVNYPKCSLALTTRPYSSVDRLKGLQRFSRFRVSALSIHDASRMLKNIDGDEFESGDWRRETLRKLDGVYGLELNPLLVTVFAISSRVDKKDIPANITELFSKFTELMLGRWDERKGLGQQYQAKIKDELLSEFAFQLHLEGRSDFRRQEFIEFAESRLKEVNLTTDISIVVPEILDRSGLLRGDEDVEFRHHLIQEYFAAKGMPGQQFIRDNISNDWWRNSIVFYFGARPKAVLDLLDAATFRADSDGEAFIAVGLALQACYMSKLEDRLDVWKWVNSSACKYVSVKDDIGSQKYPVTTFLQKYLEARDALALTGIEKQESEIEKWCLSPGFDVESHQFWYAVGLCELGEFGRLDEFIARVEWSDSFHQTSIHFGCYFALHMKDLSDVQKKSIGNVLRRLGPAVAMNRARITEEFRGQLLDYKRGGVIALDDVEPEVRM
jgi:energy-coupling factor transporter ATP-binding protein EcfA2